MKRPLENSMKGQYTSSKAMDFRVGTRLGKHSETFEKYKDKFKTCLELFVFEICTYFAMVRSCAELFGLIVHCADCLI